MSDNGRYFRKRLKQKVVGLAVAKCSTKDKLRGLPTHEKEMPTLGSRLKNNNACVTNQMKRGILSKSTYPC
jgi:hypothetical protein